ncbi:MAG: pilus assembly protein TadG-related protein [Chloroflexota bacterium]
MSSTTDRQRGQVLAIFALSLTAVLGAGALAFDGGMMILERRDQQNAADAAAMAGARYVTTDHAKARSVAASVASANGFTHGSGLQVVRVNVPPTTGKFATWPNAIQVEIESTRPSILAAVMGFLNWPVSASATAASLDSVGGPFSILTLAPSQCEAMKVAGTGGIVANGNIQVNSDCPTSALKRQAGGTIRVTASGAACNVNGGIQNEGGDTSLLDCLAVTGAPVIPDPLGALPDVPMPSFPLAPEELVGSRQIPNGCPGSSRPATLDSPATCQFPSNYAGTTWRLYPGVYPGGLKIQGGNFYLEPGIYWIGGGGLEITGNGSLIQSVDAGTTNEGGGVLFYNTAIAGSDIGDMKLNGASANIHLWPLDEPAGSWESTWNGLIVYQDRDYGLDGDDLTINGNDSDGMDVRGTIYLPDGDVKINGNEGDLVMDQIIAQTYDAMGNGGDILALKEKDQIYQFTAAGLVE